MRQNGLPQKEVGHSYIAGSVSISCYYEFIMDFLILLDYQIGVHFFQTTSRSLILKSVAT